jgi:hypothetical protein
MASNRSIARKLMYACTDENGQITEIEPVGAGGV